MKKLSIVFLFILCLVSVLGLAQIPEKINYQAVIRNSSGELLENQNVSIQLSILDATDDGDELYQEIHTVQTNSYGQVKLIIGEGTDQEGSMSSINWANNDKYLKINIDLSGGINYEPFGTFQLLSVPYAFSSEYADSSGKSNEATSANTANFATTATYADNASNAENALKSDTAYVAKKLDEDVLYFTNSDTLFAVKDRNGNIVFAVFPDGVRITIDEQIKGNIGGFAVSGRGTGKGSNDFLTVTPDSTRVYVNEGIKGVGGFAISGRGTGKIGSNDYLMVTKDSTRVYVDNSVKGSAGGFAVAGRNRTQGTQEPILVLNADSTRIFTKDSLGGFGVRDTKNGGNSSYMQLTPENYFIGHESGIHTTGTYNNFFGYQSGYTNTTGSNNVFMGYQSGYGMDIGTNNIILGYQAGKLSTEGNNNAIIGAYAGYENNGDYNVFIGFESGYSNVSGADARYSNYNTFIGYQTGKSNTTGWHNLCIGYQAGLDNQTATNQFFIGDNSGENLTAGYGNTYVGHLTGRFSNDCSENTILGYQAGYWNETGSNNVYIGYAAGIKALGSNNVIIGRRAGMSNQNGSGNVFIGAAAGYSYLGSNKLFIDNSSTSNPLIWGDFENDRLVINGDSTENVSGYNFYVNGDAGGYSAWNSLSDSRLKSNINIISGALEKVMMLNGIYYTWKNELSNSNREIGFIAQDVEKILPEVVHSEGEYYSMQYAPITAVLVEAMKEQQVLISNQINEIKNLKDENEKLKSDINIILKRLEDLEMK